MNPEIKFKAWDEENKSMSKPFTLLDWINAEAKHLILLERERLVAETVADNSSKWCNEKRLFLQYIWRKDCEGEEIYLGDILKGNVQYENSQEYPIMVARWDEKNYCFMLKQINGGKYDVPMNWSVDAKIIGNIYENPNLK